MNRRFVVIALVTVGVAGLMACGEASVTPTRVPTVTPIPTVAVDSGKVEALEARIEDLEGQLAQTNPTMTPECVELRKRIISQRIRNGGPLLAVMGCELTEAEKEYFMRRKMSDDWEPPTFRGSGPDNSWEPQPFRGSGIDRNFEPPTFEPGGP
jgi:hypothetical protein